MEIRKEEIQYIQDTPVRIILDDEISMNRGKLPPHWHDEIELNYVMEGSVYYIVNGVTYYLHKDDIIIIENGRIHSGRCNDGDTFEETHAEVMTVQINRDVLRYDNFEIPAFEVFLPKENNAELRSLMVETKSVFQQKNPYYQLLLNAQVLKMSYCLLTKHAVKQEKSEENSRTSKEMKLAIRYVEEHSHENVSLEDVAALVNYNPSYFSRRFHQFTGFTFSELSKLFFLADAVFLKI